MGKLIFITGGARSGKSSWALNEANRLPSELKYYIATAEPVDEEMILRIDSHRKERGSGWETIECPLRLDLAIGSLTSNSTAIIDCCTVWLGNLWHNLSGQYDLISKSVEETIGAFKAWKKNNSGNLFIVSNEVGWGIVPHDKETREYRDALGMLNQHIARIADKVYLCISGIAVCIKDYPKGEIL